MNKTVACIITAILFGGAGGAAGYFIARKKYCSLADKEVKSIMDRWEEHDKKLLKDNGIDVDDKPKAKHSNSPIVITPTNVKPGEDRLEKEKEYQNALCDYANTGTKQKVKKVNMKSPVTTNVKLLSENDFLELDCMKVSVNYYQDGVVADEDCNRINNYGELIGSESLWLNLLKKQESVWIFNIDTKIAYEVTLFHRNWEEDATEEQIKAYNG